MGLTKPRSRIGSVVTVTLLGAFALAFGGFVLSLALSLVGVEDAAGAPSLWTVAVCDVLLLAVVLIPRANVGQRWYSHDVATHENHICGSCGRRFDSRQELRAHREADHAPGMVRRSS